MKHHSRFRLCRTVDPKEGPEEHCRWHSLCMCCATPSLTHWLLAFLYSILVDGPGTHSRSRLWHQSRCLESGYHVDGKTFLTHSQQHSRSLFLSFRKWQKENPLTWSSLPCERSSWLLRRESPTSKSHRTGQKTSEISCVAVSSRITMTGQTQISSWR